MVTQTMVDGHAARIAQLVNSLEQHLELEIEDIVHNVTMYMMKSISTVNGRIRQTPANMNRVLDVEREFTVSMNRSGYYPTLNAFISALPDQVHEFREMFKAMEIGEFTITDEDRELLAIQGVSSLGTLESYVLRSILDLRHLLTRSLGDLDLREVVKGISEGIRKLSKVGPIARDQSILFFRMIGNLSYQNVESSGTTLVYDLVGPIDENSRPFCARLKGEWYARSEIDLMDNGQVTGVFISGGGYGCRHWWAARNI